MLRRPAGAYTAGDTDLAWTRITLWRGLLAAAARPAAVRARDPVVVSGEKHAPVGRPARRPGSAPGPASARSRSSASQRRDGAITRVTPGARGAATSCWTVPTARPSTLHQPGSPTHRIALPIRAAARVPGRGAAAARPGRGLRGDADQGARTGGGDDPRRASSTPDADVVGTPTEVRRPRPGCSPACWTCSRSRRPLHVVLTGRHGRHRDARGRGRATRCGTPSTGRGVHLWWGDERFLPDGDPERNETQAREALLDRARRTRSPRRTSHPMPAGRRRSPTPEEVARLAAYCASTRRAAEPAVGRPRATGRRRGARVRRPAARHGTGRARRVAVPRPRRPGRGRARRRGVHGSPKPPPERVSLTFDAIRAAREVWIVAAGAEKAARSPPRWPARPVDGGRRPRAPSGRRARCGCWTPRRPAPPRRRRTWRASSGDADSSGTTRMGSPAPVRLRQSFYLGG